MTISYARAVAAAEEQENDGRPLVVVERSDARAIVTLDDPERLNPLSAALTVQLHRELDVLARQPEQRAIVITGRDPAFSAGGDLRIGMACQRAERKENDKPSSKTPHRYSRNFRNVKRERSGQSRRRDRGCCQRSQQP